MAAAVRRSIELRLKRADQHLVEIDLLVDTYRKSNPYGVRCTVEGKRKEFVYRLARFSEPADELAVIVGDFLHNVRSALNYCMAGIVTADRKTKTQFPIFTDNPFERVRGSRAYVQRKPEGRRNWRTYVKGCDPDTLAIIEGLQPYQRGVRINGPTYLGMLNNLNNKDKHSNLTVVSTGVNDLSFVATDAAGKYVGNGMQFDMTMLQDGTEVFRYKAEVNMQIGYIPLVALKVGENLHVPIGELRSLLEVVETTAIASLLPYLKR